MHKDPLVHLKMVGQTLREQLLTVLKQKGPLNISELTKITNVARSNVQGKLALAKGRGHVKSNYMKKENAWGGHVLVHVYQITEAGDKWLSQK